MDLFLAVDVCVDAEYDSDNLLPTRALPSITLGTRREERALAMYSWMNPASP